MAMFVSLDDLGRFKNSYELVNLGAFKSVFLKRPPGAALVDMIWTSFADVLGIQHIEAETKWPLFRRRHFQTHFLEWNF